VSGLARRVLSSLACRAGGDKAWFREKSVAVKSLLPRRETICWLKQTAEADRSGLFGCWGAVVSRRRLYFWADFRLN